VRFLGVKLRPHDPTAREHLAISSGVLGRQSHRAVRYAQAHVIWFVFATVGALAFAALIILQRTSRSA